VPRASSLPAVRADTSQRMAPQLSLDEVQVAYAVYRDRYPPIITLPEAAEIARLKPATLKRKVSEGRFRGCVRKGKPLLFWRDRFVQALMNSGR
jgi:hypothetical protein